MFPILNLVKHNPFSSRWRAYIALNNKAPLDVIASRNVINNTVRKDVEYYV